MPQETGAQTFLRFVIHWIFIPLHVPLLCIVAPLFHLYDAWIFKWFPSRHMTTVGEHNRRVAAVQAQVKAWHAGGRRRRMVTARAAWAQLSIPGFRKQDFSQIQIDDLTHVVEIDTKRKTVTVEPGMMTGRLTSLLIERGWTIPVIPEFEILTVGGLICGTGVESSSVRHGLFCHTPIEYDVVLSNGDLVTCSEQENADLFHAMPWSHGTLGFLTAVKLPLLPAARYVELEYHPSRSIAEAQRLLESTEHEFVEGIAYTRDQSVVTLGNFVEKVDPKRGRVNHINRWYKPFFHMHMKSFLRALSRGGAAPAPVRVEYIPLRDYYHRHTRGYFWAAQEVMPFINNAFFRLLFGWILPVNVNLVKRMTFALGLGPLVTKIVSFNIVGQDFLLPMRHLEASVEYSHQTVEIYPLWLCPCKFFKKPGMAPSRSGADELYIDLGVYGTVAKHKQPGYDFERSSQEMEAFVMDHEGFQFLYSACFLSREEFDRMFDMRLYEEVRTKYGAQDAFPNVYDKVSKYARGLVQV